MILTGDSLQELNKFPDNHFHSVVTDPPYGLKFMGKRWDYNVPSVELWREVLRVLKPGGHVLSFGGTRTYHRMVVAIEEAGFEIRDQLQWIYGSGFPKSHNIKEGPFKGWGTALKPANEPICLARKPFKGTVAQNVEIWGCGAINVDGTRIEAADQDVLDAAVKRMTGNKIQTNNSTGNFVSGAKEIQPKSAQGRWPANVMLDEDAAAMLGEPSRFFYVAKASKRERNAGLEGMPEKPQGAYGKFAGDGRGRQTEHQPTANHHPTVKPIRLMEYLCRLITPPGGIVLDPFCGSGSTGVAAKSLGFDFVGIELNAEYAEIASKRLEASA